MPAPRNQFATASSQGKIYAIGGQFRHDSTSGNALDQARVDVYDPTTDTWSPGPSLPQGHSHAEGSTFLHRGSIYVIGGRSVRQTKAAIWALGPEDEWSEVGELAQPLLGPAARIVDGQLVVIGGAPTGVTPHGASSTRKCDR